jgi:hypothetical protein
MTCSAAAFSISTAALPTQQRLGTPAAGAKAALCKRPTCKSQELPSRAIPLATRDTDISKISM